MLTANKARQIAIDNSQLDQYLATALTLIKEEAMNGRMETHLQTPEIYLKPLQKELKKLGYQVQIITNIMGMRTFQTLRISWK